MYCQAPRGTLIRYGGKSLRHVPRWVHFEMPLFGKDKGL